MQVFFIMAGMTSSSSRSLYEQIRQKSKRLLFPYFIYGIILLCAGVLLPTHAEFGRGLLALLYGRYSVYPPSMDAHIPLLQSCGFLSPLWFLPCIFLSYVLLAWYDCSRFPSLIVLLSIAVSVVTPLLPILLPWGIEMAFIGFLLMLFGRTIRPLLLESPTKFSRAFFEQLGLWLGCAALYVLLWGIASPVNMSLSEICNSNVVFPLHFVYFCLLGICETFFFTLFFRTIQTTITTKSLAYIGRQALRLLIIHLFIGECVYYLVSKLDMPTIIPFGCAILSILLINSILDRLSKRISIHLAWTQYL